MDAQSLFKLTWILTEMLVKYACELCPPVTPGKTLEETREQF